MADYTFYDTQGRVTTVLSCTADELKLNLPNYAGQSYIEGFVNANTHDVVNGVPTPHNRGSLITQMMTGDSP